MHYSYRIYPLQFQLMYSQMTIYTHRCCPSHNAGCTATFTDTAVNITYEQHTILTGSKDPTSTLWHIPIPEHLPILSPPSASAVQGIAPDAAFVRFAHATFGSRALSTFHKAIRCNYLASFPRLNPQNCLSTSGELYSHRARASRPETAGTAVLNKPILLFDADSESDSEDDSTTDASAVQAHSNHAFTKVIPMSTEAHSDLTGRFPVTSFTGHQYVFITVMNSYIHVEPMKTRHHTDYIAAYKKTITFFGLLGRKVLFQRLDNETSAPLEAFARSNGITIEYCPPHQHCSLKAERAIRTFKNHFIATLGTVDSNFPMQLWDELLPRTELCLNHLLPYAPNPDVSAYAGLHGGAFDFSKHPIAPAGARVLIHDKPNIRASWAPHDIPGYYLGPATQHHRCYRVWSVNSKQTRITDTVARFLENIELPGATAHDLLLAAIRD